jgi:hypothetical protein
MITMPNMKQSSNAFLGKFSVQSIPIIPSVVVQSGGTTLCSAGLECTYLNGLCKFQEPKVLVTRSHYMEFSLDESWRNHKLRFLYEGENSRASVMKHKLEKRRSKGPGRTLSDSQATYQGEWGSGVMLSSYLIICIRSPRSRVSEHLG